MSTNRQPGAGTREIQASISGMTRTNVARVMAQLEALLEALPADTSSDSDARLRHDIEVLLAGYKAGTPSRRLRPPMVG